MNTVNENHIWELRKIEDQLFLFDSKTWLVYDFLTWQWWMLVVFLVVPWIIWYLLVKRDTLMEAFLFGTITMIITKFLDVVGLQFSFWEYPIELIPVIPRGFPFDISMVPVAYMLLFQYFKTWKTFIVAQIIMAAMFAFIGEPFSEWAQLVYYIKWNYFFSFLYYILVGVGTKYVLLKLISIQNTA